MKIFKSAALLCAVSFIPLQASDCANLYGINQESARNNRCIRVITEIPVEILDSSMPHHGRCEYAVLPSASECLRYSSGACQEKNIGAVLQYLIELTKNLKVASADVEPKSAFGIGGVVPPPHPLTAAVEVAKVRAADAAKKAIAAEKAAKVAEKEANDLLLSSRTGEDYAIYWAEKEKKATAAREAAEWLMGNATKAVATANATAAKAIAAGQPAFVYEEPAPSSIAGTMLANTAKENHFKTLAPDPKKISKPAITYLQTAVNGVMSLPEVVNPLRTNVDITERVLSALRGAGAPLPDIFKYLPHLTMPDAIRSIALYAIPWPDL